MNYDRLIALFHVSMAYHSGQFSPLYRLGCIVGRHITPAHSEEYATVLDLDGYEEARELYGKYAVALGGASEESTYMPCACEGCWGDNIVGEEWERGILRCDACRENGCERSCECPKDDEESDLDSDEYTDKEEATS